MASTLLGFLLAAARDSELKGLQWFAIGYSTLFRNTPLLIQLFFWYFAASRKPNNVEATTVHAEIHNVSRNPFHNQPRYCGASNQ